MFESMRTRLTAWYAGVLAFILIAFAFATYTYLLRLVRIQADQSLADTANSVASSLKTELDDSDKNQEAEAREVTSGFHFHDRQVIIYDEANRMIAASDKPEHAGRWFAPDQVSPAIEALIRSTKGSSLAYATLPGRHGRIRAVAVPVLSNGKSYVVMIAGSAHDEMEEVEQVRHASYVAIPLALLLAGVGGYFLVRKGLSPVVAMSNQAAKIGADNLHERLPVSNGRDELGQLAISFNELLARLDRSFEQQRRFMADASHELRTPVAIVCGEAEVALSQNERPGEDYRESLAIIHDEGRRLTRIVEDLFTLARADAGQYPLSLTEFYLDETVDECVRSIRTLAAQQNVTLHYEPQNEEVLFRGDEALVRRMVLNILDNALKYTPGGGEVRVRVIKEMEAVVIVIEDTGCGIPPEAQAHIFDRFYRADKARSRTNGAAGSGAGLGLSIARWIAGAHGGRINLERSNEQGTMFAILLPLSNDLDDSALPARSVPLIEEPDLGTVR